MIAAHTPRTLFDKVWASHEVIPETADTPAVLYIDMHLAHEVSSPHAFAMLKAARLTVRRPDRTLATLDHSIPTRNITAFVEAVVPEGAAAIQVRTLEQHARQFGIELFRMSDPRRGIVHVIGPELGITQPGMTLVCGDSHTSTHGAFGALAFGVGSTEVAHVFATQCLLQRKPTAFEVRVDGNLSFGVTAKDLILMIIGKLGVSAGTGQVIEYRGSTIGALTMEERMTVCNMSIEAGSRAGMIAPDETTFAYIDGRPRAPRDLEFQRAVARWRTLVTDEGARFAGSISLNATDVEPMITYGTNPGMSIPITASIPDDGDAAFYKALSYMGVKPGETMLGKPIDVVFIGSCTNGRIEDLQAAARILQDRKIASGVHCLIVPGSQQVKRMAEATGLAHIFKAAGADWRESGCSMCVGINGDTVKTGSYCVSTSNRNFEGRQGVGARTLLASPLTAAACAVSGRISDPRAMLAAR
jgi:3-isopropylmalate/(R)-2-methylmalate dehydratase large subunit